MDDISQTAYRIRSRECFPQRTNVRSASRRGRGSRPWPLAALQGLGIGDMFATDGRREDALESLVCGP